MRVACAVVAVVAGCTNESGSMLDCTLETGIARLNAPAAVDSCGSLSEPPYPRSDAQPAFMNARACVGAHLAARTPFSVAWGQNGIDSIVRGAYVGVERDGIWTIRKLFYDSYGSDVYTVASCRDLPTMTACDDDALFANLCFTCEGELAVDRCSSGESIPPTGA
jgi:hypothetical protein